MGRYGGEVLVFLMVIPLSLQSTDDGIPANLTILLADVELNEREDARTMLGGGPVVTCMEADGDAVRAYIQSISPTSGCATRCLQLEPCGGDDFCLWFLGNSALYFSTVSLYTVTIGCTDDVETAVVKDMSVTIVPNSPPVFIPDNPAYASVNIHGQKTAHDSRYRLYKVETNDTDGDPQFYTMSLDPLTDLIEIEYASGQIRAAQDLRMLCEPLVKASVWARDPYNSAVGPFTVDINVDNYNERPSITNLDTTVTINENESVDKRVMWFTVVDGKLNDHNYNQRSLTSAGMEAYGMRATALRTKIILNYEREDTRSVKLYFDVDDGYCKSETYSLTVNVVDVPEEPEYSHKYMLIQTDEGQINEPTNVFIYDEDLNEVHTHAKEVGDAEFEVEATTGNVYSVADVQLVPGRQHKDYSLKMRATDKDGLTSSRYEVKIRVFDMNDRRPYFTNHHQPFTVSAHECMDPGSILGRVKGTDDDSDYNQNNWVYFGGGGGNFDIAANGWIVLNQRCINGETYTGTATIADQGIKPGPLTGDPMGVIVNCGPCPSPSDTTTAAATTAAPSNSTTAAASTGDTGGGGGGSSTDDLLTWAIPALVGAVTWLALTIFFIYRFCCPCKNPCSGCVKHRPPTPTRVSPEPPKEKPPPPPPKPLPPRPKSPPPPPPVPPPPPAVKPDPYLFGFWKQTYTDQDQKAPASGSKPIAIENMPAGEGNELPPDHLRLGPPGANVPRFLPGNSPRAVSPGQIGPMTLAETKSKSKFCVIL